MWYRNPDPAWSLVGSVIAFWVDWKRWWAMWKILKKPRSGLRWHSCRPLNVYGDCFHLTQDNVSQGLNGASQPFQNEFRDVPVCWYQAGKDPGQTAPARQELGQGDGQSGSRQRDHRHTVPATETLQSKCSVAHRQDPVALIPTGTERRHGESRKMPVFSGYDSAFWTSLNTVTGYMEEVFSYSNSLWSSHSHTQTQISCFWGSFDILVISTSSWLKSPRCDFHWNTMTSLDLTQNMLI